jgi:hypothetical protein
MKDELAELIRSRQAGPFLFVGSGFSRRYLGLEDWRGLLSRFCVAGREFEYYLAAADGSLPRAASLLARDFNEHWWSSEDFKASVEKDKLKIADSTSALRMNAASLRLRMPVKRNGPPSLRSRDLQPRVGFWPAFFHAGLNASGPISHPDLRNQPEQGTAVTRQLG